MEKIVQIFQSMRELLDSKLDTFHNMGVIQDLNLLENLKLVEIHIKEKDIRKAKIEKIVSQFEFDPLLKIKAKHLSGGQKKS